MIFEYTDNQEVIVNIRSYVEDMLEELPTKFKENDKAKNQSGNGMLDEGETGNFDKKSGITILHDSGKRLVFGQLG